MRIVAVISLAALAVTPQAAFYLLISKKASKRIFIDN